MKGISSLAHVALKVKDMDRSLDFYVGKMGFPEMFRLHRDGTLWIVFNGEIFNHVELRPELEARGHRFATHTDTEVIVHLYEEFGPACVSRLNGQFAFAIWDVHKRSLFLARDRLGTCPLFYTIAGGALIFASEIKAILADRRVAAAIDPLARSVGAMALYPFDGPPYRPFQRWAMRAEPVAPSPLGLFIHPEYGLWHAYRAALVFA